MEPSPPMNSRKEKPKFCHTYTAMTTTIAHCVLVSQGTAGIPIRDSAQLMTPYLSLNRYRIRIETLAADSTRGKKNVERKNTRNQLGMRDCTRTASSIATPSCAATADRKST